MSEIVKLGVGLLCAIVVIVLAGAAFRACNQPVPDKPAEEVTGGIDVTTPTFPPRSVPVVVPPSEPGGTPTVTRVPVRGAGRVTGTVTIAPGPETEPGSPATIAIEERRSGLFPELFPRPRYRIRVVGDTTFTAYSIEPRPSLLGLEFRPGIVGAYTPAGGDVSVGLGVSVARIGPVHVVPVVVRDVRAPGRVLEQLRPGVLASVAVTRSTWAGIGPVWIGGQPHVALGIRVGL